MYDDLTPLLHYTRLSGIVNKKPQTTFFFQREVFTAKETEANESFARDIVFGHRTPAKLNAISAPAQVSRHEKIGQQHFRLGEIKIKRRLNERDLLYARKLGTESEKMAMSAITKTLTEMRYEVDLTVEKALADALTGTLTVDNRSDPQNPVYWQNTYAVTQINSPGYNGWVSSPTEKILTNDLTALANRYADLVGLQLSRAITTSEVTDGILRNTEVKDWYKATNNDILANGLLPRLKYLEFKPYDEGYDTTRYAGAVSINKFIPANTVYLMPAGNDRMGATIVEGPSLIPRTAFGAEGESPLVEVPPGYYSYSEVTSDPPGMWIYLGYKFAPVIYWPEAIVKFTVV